MLYYVVLCCIMFRIRSIGEKLRVQGGRPPCRGPGEEPGRVWAAAQHKAEQQGGQTLVVAVVTTLLPEKMLTLAPFLSSRVAFLAPTITGLLSARQTIAA